MNFLWDLYIYCRFTSLIESNTVRFGSANSINEPRIEVQIRLVYNLNPTRTSLYRIEAWTVHKWLGSFAVLLRTIRDFTLCHLGWFWTNSFASCFHLGTNSSKSSSSQPSPQHGVLLELIRNIEFGTAEWKIQFEINNRILIQTAYEFHISERNLPPSLLEK